MCLKKQLNEEALKALTAICYFLKIKTGYNINHLSKCYFANYRVWTTAHHILNLAQLPTILTVYFEHEYISLTVKA